MGIFDEIRKLVDSASKPAPQRAPPTPSSGARPATPPAGSGAKGALQQAQQRRRAGEVKGNDGKTLTKRRFGKYESLERAVVADAGAFPWSDEQVRAALARQGFDAAHVAAYLRSPAARRLLE